MTDAPQQIGQYRIDREVGRGGMGVVYQAHDSRLGRNVAIKALPDEVSQDAERLARFEREARALAQLDHPNLAGIYGIEEHEGRRYLVLEYVEGETLSAILDRGPLSLDDTIDWCSQIAAGVASAHDGGVVHRDLKPDNVKITPEGKAKVLDFGLAKASDPQSSTSMSGSMSPTLTTPRGGPGSQTIPGAIMGTAPYMSPEQARGRHVDRRTDVWSFGCILYECLTGARLFAGESATDSMGAILHKEISFDLLPDSTPPRVRELLARMLERDKEKRLRDLGDAMLELQAARGERGAGPRNVKTPQGMGPVIVVALMALTGIVSGIAVWGLSKSKGVVDGAQSSRPSAHMTRLTDAVGAESFPTISPNGETIVFTMIDGGDTDIFTRRVNGLNATNLTADSDSEDLAPAFSPDGQYIAFRSDRDGGGIFVMGATGESPRRLTEFGEDPAWSPDGSKLVFSTERIVGPFARLTRSALWTVDFRSGETERIFEGDAVQPSWSPSGERIAYWRVEQSGRRDIFTIGADGSNPVAVMDDAPTDWSPEWAPDGRRLYFCSDRGGSMAIWRVPIDESTGEILGELEQVTTSTREGAGSLSFSGDGRRLVFAAGIVETLLFRAELDPATGQAIGEPFRLLQFNTSTSQPAISPDGLSIAYSSTGEQQEDLYLVSADGATRRRVTNDAAKDRGPRWLSDGDRLIFYSDRDSKYRIWSIRTDGGDLRMVAEIDDNSLNVPRISPDGRYLSAFSSNGEMYVFRLEPGNPAELLDLPPAPAGYSGPSPLDWSPDSRRLLITWNESAETTTSITMLDIETGVHTPLAAEARGLFTASFMSDERFVMARTPDGIYRIDTRSGESTPVFSDPQSIEDVFSFDLAPDDSWMVLNTFEVEVDIWMMEFED